MKRIFLIVLDSMGIGAMDDAGLYGDEGSNTLLSISKSRLFHLPNFRRLGLFNIDSVPLESSPSPIASFARMKEASSGKDTVTGHFEIAGTKVSKPFPVYPNGFPRAVMDRFESLTGYKTVCNKPYSGTDVICDYGEHHQKTKDLIVYTSADSVFQIAAHEELIPVSELYRCCKIARKILTNEHMVARVIARPFVGEDSKYVRTKNRRDFSVLPPGVTMLDQLKESGFDVVSVGKISDIFVSRGITSSTYTSSNQDGIDCIVNWLSKDFEGLCFSNLVDFDTLYGHRNDVEGYARAMSELDERLPEIISNLKQEDILMITADHGCDPAAPSTDHSREYTPLLIYGHRIKKGVNLGTRPTFSDIGRTILDYFKIPSKIEGESFLKLVTDLYPINKGVNA
ncbi:MAG: phosphopentomutase [Oscillospiraceae bacterium]|jgi:phosphopentomutase|nr:phosphopentomutase [Oscillospiraceae bacterium]